MTNDELQQHEHHGYETARKIAETWPGKDGYFLVRVSLAIINDQADPDKMARQIAQTHRSEAGRFSSVRNDGPAQFHAFLAGVAQFEEDRARP